MYDIVKLTIDLSIEVIRLLNLSIPLSASVHMFIHSSIYQFIHTHVYDIGYMHTIAQVLKICRRRFFELNFWKWIIEVNRACWTGNNYFQQNWRAVKWILFVFDCVLRKLRHSRGLGQLMGVAHNRTKNAHSKFSSSVAYSLHRIRNWNY